MPIYAMHIAQRFVCAFFTLPHNMRDTSMHIDQWTVCCLCFWTHINLLWNHLNLWDDSSAWEMLSLLLFVSSKLFECFFRFLCRPCFLWALCFLWPCFFGDCGWPTLVVVIVDWGGMLGSLCSMKWTWFLVQRDFLGHIQFEWIPFTWLGSVLEQGRRQSSSYPSLITGAGGRVWRQVLIDY